MKTDVAVVAVTGGPGGGKSMLLRKIGGSRDLSVSCVALEEAIHGMRFVRMTPTSKEFQCALVAIQAGMEANLARALRGTGRRLIVSHRGTLDPCAFWQSFGNSRDSFFEMTGTTLDDHYSRYDLVIHMETAAIGVPGAYVRYPHAHRPEDLKAATELDHLLGKLWCDHPAYIKITGTPDIEEKLARGEQLIREILEHNDEHLDQDRESGIQP